MVIKQISVFLQNEKGRLEEVTEILSQHGINISALSIAETAEYGVLRMIINDTDKAVAVLKENDFTVKVTDVICIETLDVPGALNKALKLLSAESINVSYMYGYCDAGIAHLIIKVSDPEKAIQVLDGKTSC